MSDTDREEVIKSQGVTHPRDPPAVKSNWLPTSVSLSDEAGFFVVVIVFKNSTYFTSIKIKSFCLPADA